MYLHFGWTEILWNEYAVKKLPLVQFGQTSDHQWQTKRKHSITADCSVWSRLQLFSSKWQKESFVDYKSCFECKKHDSK